MHIIHRLRCNIIELIQNYVVTWRSRTHFYAALIYTCVIRNWSISMTTWLVAVVIFVAVVKALDGRNREPGGVGAIIIDHMFHVSPHELVALVDCQPRKCRVVPPVPLLAGAATAPPHVLGGRHRGHALARVNLEALVGGNEGCMAPVGLHPSALCSPIVGVPNWAVHAHGLVPWERYPLVLHVRVHTNWYVVN